MICNGIGCDHCDRGYHVLTECPQKYIGPEMIEDINIVAQCENGVLPVVGGLLDQSSYYFELTSTLKADQALIEREQRARK